jgi:signal transduction histidine kinase
MGHDLRAPLNAIVGFADLMAMDEVAPVTGSQRQSVDIVRRSAQDLLVLLDQILDWARLEAGRIALLPREHPPGALVAAAIDEARRRSADRGLAVHCDLPADLPAITVDADRFVEALLGLLDHASRTANAPDVLVSARLAQLSPQERALCIEVHDPALRIRAADHGTFFEPFRPSFAPSGRRIAGLGLGPALARALIRAHGGDVWFASDAHKGTTFHLRLPVPPAAPPGNP